MRKVLLLHGPNLNRLGRRDRRFYPAVSLEELERQVATWGRLHGLDVSPLQSNHEGALVDALQQASDWAFGALVNFGALSHTSYVLHDALLDFGRPAVEVHLSNVGEREEWRRKSVVRAACVGSVAGRGIEGYREALEILVEANGNG